MAAELLELRVAATRWEAERIVSFELRDPRGAPLPAWEPGAHVEVHLPGGLVRQWSLCSDPADRETWRIAVLRLDDGRGGSLAAHERLTAGTVVRVAPPRNRFPLAADHPGPVLLLAGGIGITPLLPMARALARSGAAWRLVYGARSRGALAFAGELAALGGTVELVAEDEAGRLDLDALVVQAGVRGETVYACGPAPMLDALAARTAAAGWPQERLRTERFAAAAAGADGGASVTAGAFDVRLARSGAVVHVAPGDSILDAVRAAGVEVASSCEQGVCGTCETRVLGGVPDHRDQLLTDAERAAGETMMICVGRCAEGPLVLDL
jgi:tetrachlorobenzoquinone reductase